MRASCAPCPLFDYLSHVYCIFSWCLLIEIVVGFCCLFVDDAIIISTCLIYFVLLSLTMIMIIYYFVIFVGFKILIITVVILIIIVVVVCRCYCY